MRPVRAEPEPISSIVAFCTRAGTAARRFVPSPSEISESAAPWLLSPPRRLSRVAESGGGAAAGAREGWRQTQVTGRLAPHRPRPGLADCRARARHVTAIRGPPAPAEKSLARTPDRPRNRPRLSSPRWSARRLPVPNTSRAHHGSPAAVADRMDRGLTSRQ